MWEISNISNHINYKLKKFTFRHHLVLMVIHVVCGKECKSKIRKFLRLNEISIPPVDPTNPVQNGSYVCHICLKSKSGLKSHIRTHKWELIIDQDV